jgi:hypothetical protein
MIKLFTSLLLSWTTAAFSQNTTHILSVQTFNGDEIESVSPFVSKTSDGGYILNVYSTSTKDNINETCAGTINRQVYLKYNKSGTTLEWQRCFNSADYSPGFIVETKNASYVAGKIGPTFHSPMYIRKEDNAPNLLWEKTINGNGGEQFLGAIATDDGGCLVYGTSNSDEEDIGFHYGGMFTFDIWVIKLDADGNIAWKRILGGTGDDVAASVVKSRSNEYYVAFISTSTDYDGIGNHGLYDIAALKLDNNGNTVWKKMIGGSEIDGEPHLTLTDKGFLIATSTLSHDGDINHRNHGGRDGWLMSLDDNGNILWDKFYGTTGDEYITDACIAEDGSIWTLGIDSSNRSWFTRLDENGQLLSQRSIKGVYERARFIYPLSAGMVMLGGTYYSKNHKTDSDILVQSWGDDDIYLARLAPWTTDINETQAQSEVSIYPNPAQHEITFNLSEQYAGEYVLRIVDVLGRDVFKETCKGSTKINVESWAKGIHTAHTTTKDGSTRSAQFIVK